MRDSEIIAMLKNDCPMCGPADCACTATEQDQYREIQRLRLTDAEREAVRFCAQASLPETEKLGGVAAELCRMHAATLRGLLDRLGHQSGQ